MFGLGISELLIILVLVFLIFGAGKLPKVMEELGKGAKAFKKASDSKPKDKKSK